MNLLLPDSGLLFWMTIIFAIVFFVLAKFGFPEVPASAYAADRDIRNGHQTFLIDGQTLRQYNGGTCDDPRIGVGDIRDSQIGTCHQRIDDSGDNAFWSIYGLP